MKSYRYTLQDLDCANCAKKIEDKITSNPDYKDVIVNFSTQTLSFKTDKKEGIEEEIKTMVKAVEPDTTVITTNKKQNNVQRNNKDIIRLVVGILIYLFGMYSKLVNPVMIICTVVSAIILLYKTAIKAVKQIRNKVLDENTLIIVSAP